VPTVPYSRSAVALMESRAKGRPTLCRPFGQMRNRLAKRESRSSTRRRMIAVISKGRADDVCGSVLAPSA
jgi:hypothetical protein